LDVIDVLIITALTEEFEAAREIALATGIVEWREENKGTNLAYLLGRYVAGGLGMSVALWRSTRMGGISIGSVAGALIERLKPRCLAMCGVCAGNPADVALGDVIIAEMTYQYDEGKRDREGFFGDHRQSPMSSDWVRSAQDFRPEGLRTFGEPSAEEAKTWVLERLYGGDDPFRHPARPRYFSARTWEPRIRSLETSDLVRRDGQKLVLTDTGRAEIEATRFYRVEPPERLPFQVKVGPMASGNVVVKDGITWDNLRQWGVRSVLGLEMEAATIGSAALQLKVPHFAVVKGVMDHADFRKDDRYKPFAARASAEVLFKYLVKQLSTSGADAKQPRSSLVRAAYLIGGVTGETNYPEFEQSELSLLCTRLGEAIGQSGADLIVCSPFPDAADHHEAMCGPVRKGKFTSIPQEESPSRPHATNYRICWASTIPGFWTTSIRHLKIPTIRSNGAKLGYCASCKRWNTRMS
jgi:nucleoside phosphorylase